jgi:hypothetical protein
MTLRRRVITCLEDRMRNSLSLYVYIYIYIYIYANILTYENTSFYMSLVEHPGTQISMTLRSRSQTVVITCLYDRMRNPLSLSLSLSLYVYIYIYIYANIISYENTSFYMSLLEHPGT